MFLRRHSYGLALGGLAAVIVALSGFGLWSTLQTGSASDRASSAVRLSDVFERARYWVGQEESLERKYRLEPSPEHRAMYDAAARQLVGALRQIGRFGAPADRHMVAHLLSVHGRYLAAIASMFAAVDARNARLVIAIDGGHVDPLFGEIEARVQESAQVHHAAAMQTLQHLRATRGFMLIATPLAFGIGLLLLGFFALLLVRVHRELKVHAQEREHAALHDPLTALPNRALFADRVGHALRAARRDPTPFSVLMIDLDRFKEINDTLGHPTGDRLLQAMGPRLQIGLRPGDTIARLGGDEFALLLPGAGSREAAEIAQRVLGTLHEPFALPTVSVSVDASVGIVTFPTHGEDADTLMQRADVAMYLAKGQGGGSAIYDPTRDPYDPARLKLSGELRHALERDELELHYQPIFDTNTLEVTCVEALVRWRHPDRGLLGPDQFIALAEHTGVIRDLTVLVLRKAARQLRRWRDAGLDVDIAVNLSVANLLDSDLVQYVTEILEQERVRGDHLCLELTESMLMTDPDRASVLLNQLSALGIRFSIDDFGMGYSSLTHLRRLPVSEIKIDRSFVRNLAVDDSNAAIVRSTIELGHNLLLRVVAEGVEDARTLELLRKLGCDHVQGYHLAYPAPAEQLDDQLHTHTRPIQSAVSAS